MKLGSAMVERTLDQFDAETVPDNHPAIPQLVSLFGDHTFFLDADGLNIIMPIEPVQAGTLEGQVMKVASWSDATRTSLTPHEPDPTGTVIAFGPDDPDTAA
jgi:hypothetical protein